MQQPSKPRFVPDFAHSHPTIYDDIRTAEWTALRLSFTMCEQNRSESSLTGMAIHEWR